MTPVVRQGRRIQTAKAATLMTPKMKTNPKSRNGKAEGERNWT